MNIGGFRHKVTIQQVQATQNSLGERIETWTDFAERYAKVEPLSGRQFWDAKQFAAELDTKFTLRYLEGVTPAMRVVFQGSDYNIEAVINTEMRNRELQLMCSKVTT